MAGGAGVPRRSASFSRDPCSVSVTGACPVPEALRQSGQRPELRASTCLYREFPCCTLPRPMSKFNLNKVRLRQSGRVFKVCNRKGLSTAKVKALLSAIVGKADSPAAARVLRKEIENIGRFSFVPFKVNRKPAFLSEEGILTDVIHGHCAMFEHGQYIMIATEKVAWSEKMGGGALEKFTRGEMIRYAAYRVAAHEAISVRSLDVGESQYRAQRIEGADLAQTYPYIGANRRLLTSLLVRKGQGVPDASLSFSSSSVRTPGGRLGYEQWCRWARSVLDDIDESQLQGAGDRFIDSFARPIDLADLPAGVDPIGVFVWTNSMTLDVDLSQLEFYYKVPGEEDPTRVDSNCVQQYLDRCREPMLVSASAGGQVSTIQGSHLLSGGKLRRNKSSYSLVTKWSPRVSVHNTETGEKKTLTEWLRQEKCLHIIFSDMTYAYSDNTLFQDATIGSLVPAIQEMIKAVPNIKKTMPEKGAGDSLFTLLEARLKHSDALVCDDDPGEWADYIAIDKTKDPSALTFVHAKSGEGTIAPAMFEGVVSQGLKHLAKRHASRAEVLEKLSRWKGKTDGRDRVRVGGSAQQLIDSYLEVTARPDHVFRVVLAVTFLSKVAVDKIAKKASRGTPLNERETLLIWLLTGFMSTCRAVGAVPQVWCRP